MAAAGALLLVGLVMVVALSRRPRAPSSWIENGLVASATYHLTVDVERYHLVERQGFAEAKPLDATNVTKEADRQHHVDHVPDGFTTEMYAETEPDGFRTETYTEQEPCGQDCTSLPTSCHEVCTPQGNGFAKCDQVCSTGSQSCQPKTCTVTKTRQVPQTRTVQKSRQVPKFKDVPVMAPWYRWTQWAWERNRTLEESGSGFETTWPSETRVALRAGLAAGEDERETRRGEYAVDYRTASGKVYSYRPTSEAEYVKSGDTYLPLRVDASGSVSPVGAPRAGPPPLGDAGALGR